MRIFPLLAAGMLAACTLPAQQKPPTELAPPSAPQTMIRFAAKVQPAPTRSNTQMARDFLDLHFRLENGQALPRFTRFEGPIRIATRPGNPPTLLYDLDQLIIRLRREAGLDIARANTGDDVNILVEPVSRAQIARVVPHAACFVIPNVLGWSDFRSKRNSPDTSWENIKTRTTATLFVPNDVPPQELRDCLHEELAQALGPLNDLYRLPDSVFNDDNFHAVLTGFDMLMLRATYAPELHSGMDRRQVAEKIGPILARLNPRGRRNGGVLRPSPRPWINAMEVAIGPRGSSGAHIQAAQAALTIAQAEQINDTRLGFNLFVLSRLILERDPESALRYMAEAGELYATLPDHDIQRAHIAMQMSAFFLANGRDDMVLRLTREFTPIAQAAENAILLATFKMMEAEAKEAQGDAKGARAARLDSLGWARYGFGNENAVSQRLVDIAALRQE
jgi:hypothetical protein